MPQRSALGLAFSTAKAALALAPRFARMAAQPRNAASLSTPMGQAPSLGVMVLGRCVCIPFLCMVDGSNVSVSGCGCTWLSRKLPLSGTALSTTLAGPRAKPVLSLPAPPHGMLRRLLSTVCFNAFYVLAPSMAGGGRGMVAVPDEESM